MISPSRDSNLKDRDELRDCHLAVLLMFTRDALSMRRAENAGGGVTMWLEVALNIMKLLALSPATDRSNTKTGQVLFQTSTSAGQRNQTLCPLGNE
jgi:hypothetical protein